MAAPSIVQCPVLCGRIASSLTTTDPSRTLHELHSQYSDDTELVGDRQRELLCRDRLLIGRAPGAGVMVWTQMPLRCTDSEIGYAAAWPDGERTTRALSSRAKSTNSSAMIWTPSPVPRTVDPPRRPLELPDSLAVVSAARGLGDDRPAVFVTERDQRRRVGDHPADRAWRTQGGQPIAHDRLVLGVHQSSRSGPNRDPGRLEIAKQPGRHMLMVEGDHIAAGGEAAYGLRVGVVPDRDVVHDLAAEMSGPRRAAAR